MKQSKFKSAVTLGRSTLRFLVGGWSLERKSLLFFGVALVLPIGLAFWFVLQVVANRLVMQTTRQAARDYARSKIAWRHVDRKTPFLEESFYPGDVAIYGAEQLRELRQELIDNPDFVVELLMLDDEVGHADLAHASRPANERERARLEELFVIYQEHLDELDAAKSQVRESIEQNADNAPEHEEISDLQLEEAINRQIATADEVRTAERSLEGLFRDEEIPIYASEDAPLSADPQSVELLEQLTPEEGWYVYYHAVHFSPSCLGCHSKFQGADVDAIPFRAVRVLIPHSQTQVASTTTLAIMIAIAMVTVAVTLLVVHWVLRRLVLTPLEHLHTVSDEISRGSTNLRANIDTGDEFHELADAFNRMLRHMTENQEELYKLNQELDIRVDQLAQANLGLYEANRLKSDFLANMSHELRTPLNSIIGFSEVLHDIPSLSDKQKRYAGNIQSSGKLLLDMINDILDLAKVEAGKMQITPTSFDLRMIVEGQCDMMRALVDEKNVDLRTEYGNDLPQVFQDQAKIQQILTNLLSNAIKFTPDGGMITVRVDIVRTSQAEIDARTGEYFEISVTDTGVGIPESDFEIIFEKFRQSNAVLQNDGLTRQYAGTGLGLSIVKELCRLLGGEIRLSSQLGTGSTFCVLLPVQFGAEHAEEAIPV